MNLPPNGSLVRITTPPRSSYINAGDVMRVRYPQKVTPRSDVHVWNEEHDCGTFDRAFNWDVARWEVVQCAR